jgi:hypothetical protein
LPSAVASHFPSGFGLLRKRYAGRSALPRLAIATWLALASWSTIGFVPIRGQISRPARSIPYTPLGVGSVRFRSALPRRLAIRQIAAARSTVIRSTVIRPTAARLTAFAASLTTATFTDAGVSTTSDPGLAFELIARFTQLAMFIGNRPHDISIPVVESIKPQGEVVPPYHVAQVGGEDVLRTAAVEAIVGYQAGLFAPGAARPVELVAPVVIVPAADAADVVYALAAIVHVAPRPQRIEAPPRPIAPVAPRGEPEPAADAVVVAEEVVIGSGPYPQVNKEPVCIERTPRPIAEARLQVQR